MSRSETAPPALRPHRSNSMMHHKQSITIDTLRMDELRAAQHVLSTYFPHEEVPSMAQLSTRFEQAPHLTLGAFVTLPPPMVSGPLSGTNDSRRKLVGVISATASPANITQSMYGHSTSNLARVVCIQDFGVEQGQRHQGIGTNLLVAFIRRLQTMDFGDKAHGQEYEIISVVCPRRRKSFFQRFEFQFHAYSYEQRAADVWAEMRRPINTSTSLSIDTSFAQEDWADQHSALSSKGMLPLLETTTHQTSSRSYHANDTEGPSSSYEPSMFRYEPNSPSVMTPVSATPNNDHTLALLLQKANMTEGAARDLGIIPSSAPNKPKKNPGKALEAIFGEAFASKTFEEDIRQAVKSRIVDFKYYLNLHPLLCPNESCDCTLVARNSAEWSIRETGPLMNTVPSVNGETSDSLGNLDNPIAPWMNSLFRTSSDAHATIGPLRGFWHVPNPMGFDNVTFSRCIEWNVPNRTFQSSQNQESTSPSSSLPSHSGRSSSIGVRRKRSSRNSFSTLRQSLHLLESSPQEVPENATLDTSDESRLDVMPGEKRLVKHILCPDCGCGPLGFAILPRTATHETQQKDIQNNDCYLAAFRVRYNV